MHHRRDNLRFFDVSLRWLLFLFLMVGLNSSVNAQQRMVQATTGVDTSLIRELKADGYGMKKYVVAFLKAGPNTDQDSITRASLQSAHLKNIQRMANEGKLVIAGPFLDDTELKGIYVFNVASVEEARALTESDPAIKAGRLVMELHPWYGSAALQKVNEIHARIQARTF